MSPLDFSHPSEKLYVIGITGTNGKTTTAHLIGEVLKSAGYNPFVLGTLNSGHKDLTTPLGIDIERIMRAHLEQGGTHFIMEVSSEGIAQSRILEVSFNIKVLTNITSDHLDYHKTFKAYRQVKLGFMKSGDSYSVYPKDFKDEEVLFPTRLLGEFNLLNIKAAVKVLRYMHVGEQYIREALASCGPPKGRLETIEEGQSYLVFVDYAHTPDALENVLSTLKCLSAERQGNLIVVFGCGGDRDSSKRSRMGTVASGLADFIIVTDDNPRSEKSLDIIDEIVKGFSYSFDRYEIVEDRKKAIQYAVNRAEENDVVVIAGKGHETYQVLRRKTVYFNDVEVSKEAVRNKLVET